MLFIAGTMEKFGGQGLCLCEKQGTGLRLLQVDKNLVDGNYQALISSDRFLTTCRTADGTGAAEVCVVDNAFRILLQCTADSHGSCHVHWHEPSRMLTVAGYFTGSLTAMNVDDALSVKLRFVFPEGSRIHQSFWHNGHLFACDAGLDCIRLFDEVRGMLVPRAIIRFPSGTAPRHALFLPNGKGYVALESGNAVAVLNACGDAYSIVQTVRTLPEDCTVKSTAAAIRASKDGTKLYVSNRGHGSIVRYAVADDGMLTVNGWLDAGKTPRDFVLCDDDEHLLIADQEGQVTLRDMAGNVLDSLDIPGALSLCLLDEPHNC